MLTLQNGGRFRAVVLRIILRFVCRGYGMLDTCKVCARKLNTTNNLIIVNTVINRQMVEVELTIVKSLG